MNARAAVLSVVILALLALISTPSAEAGTCVIAGDQCFNSTYTTANGGQQLLRGNETLGIPPDPRVYASGNAANCTAAGGTYYPEENMLGDPLVPESGVPVCKTACCCNLQTSLPGQVKQPANACMVGTVQVSMQEGDTTCSSTCNSNTVLPPAQCPEGRIDGVCSCGNVPTTQSDIDLGHVCCWNGQIKSNMNACPAKPGNYCQLNVDISAPCQCGTVMVSEGKCCTGSIPKGAGEACPAAPTTGAVCGNKVREGQEACDATYTYVNGAWTAVGVGCANSDEICTSACGCQQVEEAVCGDGLCDSSEGIGTIASNPDYCAVDCPLQPTCQPVAGQYPAPTGFRAAWNLTAQQVDLLWNHPLTCDSNRGGYRLQRSMVSMESAKTNPDHTEYINDRSQRTTIDRLPRNATILYYALYATYDNGANQGVALFSLAVPNSLCPGDTASYCANSTYGINCQGYNVTSVADCTTQPGQPLSACSLQTGEATCVPASSQCDLCNGLFSTFPDDERRILVGSTLIACGNPASTCYKDLGQTSVPLYKSCTQVHSCGSYRSEEACESNLCGIGSLESECEWNLYNGIGYCQAENEHIRECDDCTIENGCNEEICSDTGDQCYFYDPDAEDVVRTDIPPGCYPPEEVVCEMYTNETSCLGGSTFRLNVAYSSPSTRVSGDNRDLSLTNDPAQLGKCLWIPPRNEQPGLCVRDADNNSFRDLGNNAPLDLLRDFTNPSSAVLGSPNTTYPKEFTVQFSSDAQNTYMCFSRPQSACYPNQQLVQGGEIRRDFTQAEDNGTWVLRHYGTDLSKNLEYVQQFIFQIDTESPRITLTTNQTAYLYSATELRSHVDVDIRVSERATCTTQLTLNGESVPGVRELQQIHNRPEGVFGQNFSYSYPQLADGQYALLVSCEDTSQNENATAHSLVVDTNADITNPRPAARLPPHNTTQLTIQIDTIRNATCRYGQNDSAWSDMTPYRETDSRSHSAVVTLGTGEYRYRTACDFGTAIIYGGAADDIVFSIDTLSPSVALCDADRTDASAETCTTPFANNASEQHRISFRCSDRPTDSPSFGCDRIAIYSCIDNASGCNYAPNGVVTAVGTTPQRLRYFAIDRGGTRGTEQSILLNLTDKTPPSLEFTLE